MHSLKIKTGTAVTAVTAGWIAAVAFDLFVHAGALAYLYTRKSAFLLGAENAFYRIPLGYLSFLALTFVLFWLLRRTRARGGRAGLQFGLKFGFAVWGAFLLGLYSISTAAADLLLGWWIGQSLELGISGFVMGSVIGGVSRKRTAVWLAVFFFLMIALTVLLQSIGLAPAMKKI